MESRFTHDSINKHHTPWHSLSLTLNNYFPQLSAPSTQILFFSVFLPTYQSFSIFPSLRHISLFPFSFTPSVCLSSHKKLFFEFNRFPFCLLLMRFKTSKSFFSSLCLSSFQSVSLLCCANLLPPSFLLYLSPSL